MKITSLDRLNKTIILIELLHIKHILVSNSLYSDYSGFITKIFYVKLVENIFHLLFESELKRNVE